MRCAKDTCPVQECVIVQSSFSAVYKNFKSRKFFLQYTLMGYIMVLVKRKDKR